MKLRQNVCLGEIADDFESGSLGQILKKPYVHSRGHNFSLIIMKIGQNVCLDEISDEIENGSWRGQKLGH